MAADRFIRSIEIMKYPRPITAPSVLPITFVAIVAIAVALARGGSEEPTVQDTPPSDDLIQQAVERVLRYDLRVFAMDVDVAVRDGVAELSGFVENLPMKRMAIGLTETRKGVRAIVDRMEVRGVRRDDEAIQQSLDRALSFQGATFGVGVEPLVNDGVVRLHGTVDSFGMSDLVERTAESIVGVRGIVNMLHVEADDDRDDAELRRHIDLALAQDPWVDSGLVTIAVEDGDVKIAGLIDSLAEKRRLRETIGGIPGVTAIDDDQLDIKVDIALKEPMERQQPPELSDAEIRKSVEDALRFDPRVRRSRLEATVEGGVVSLNGHVDNLKAFLAAESDARNAAGVTRVYNFIEIRPENPLPDGELAEGIEAMLEADNLLAGADFDEVVSESGLVRLRGMVETEFQRRRAENLTAGAIGVREVRNYLRVDWPVPEAYRDLVE